ncbi:MAG: GntP family permease [Planctomycetota bacterium]
MALLGILLALALLMVLAYRGWSVLLLAPLAAMFAAATAGEPLLAHWTQTFMMSAARFIAQFFPIFLLGALFGKLMDDSGSVTAIANFFTAKLGAQRAILAVVISGALVTYGGVSLFVAFFVLVPMANRLFEAARIPKRFMPATIALGTMTFTMSALPGSPAIQNAIPMPFFGTTPFAAPGLGLIASAVMLVFGLIWLRRAKGAPPADVQAVPPREDLAKPQIDKNAELLLRERSTQAGYFDLAEIPHGAKTPALPSIGIALLPLAVVIGVNLCMSLFIVPRWDVAFLAEPAWGNTSIAAVGGVWSVLTALIAAIVTLVACNRRRLGSLRDTMDAGANASALPVLSVASLVGFGSVIAALPAFDIVRDWVLGIQGGPLVSLTVATNVLAALTGSASGGLTIALESLGETFMRVAADTGLDPALMHRVAVIGAGTLDSLPHNGAVVTLLSVCGTTHREGYMDMVVVGILGPILALVTIIVLGSFLGSF